MCKIVVFSNQYSFPLHFVEMEAREGVFGPPTLAPMTPKYLPNTQDCSQIECIQFTDMESLTATSLLFYPAKILDFHPAALPADLFRWLFSFFC